MRESTYQKKIIDRLREMFPGCEIIKGPSNYIQGFQDLIIFFEDRWATLEVKVSATAEEQPNQAYYVEKHNRMSFSAFIYPENEDEVLHELQLSFVRRRKARAS